VYHTPMRISTSIRLAVLCLAALGLFSLTAPAQAQTLPGEVVGLLNTGVYFVTGGSGRNAIGSTKFYNEGHFYTRPAHLGALLLTGGVESMEASDHFLPFTGGNDYSLIGLSARLSTPHKIGRLQPYVSVGYFVGNLRSVDLDIDQTRIIPSASIGVDYPISRILSLTASYRVSEHIAGINTDGFGISLRLF